MQRHFLLCCLGFGGEIIKKREVFSGRVGVNWDSLKLVEGCDSEVLKASIWLNKAGGFYKNHIPWQQTLGLPHH